MVGIPTSEKHKKSKRNRNEEAQKQQNPSSSEAMKTALVKEYEAHLDAKSRITIRGVENQYFAVKMFQDGRVLLEPRVLVPPEAVSKQTLARLDRAASHFKQGKVSEPINLDKYL